MTPINPLFSSSHITKKEKQKTVIQGVEDNSSHEFFLTKEYKIFASQLPALKQNTTYNFWSLGQWSLRHVVFHIVSLVGRSKAAVTTYGLGPGSARGIVDAINKGFFESFFFVYDQKIKSFKDEAHNVSAANFHVKITQIHAKATVLINENWGVVISGSANWSDSNNKIELTTISTNRDHAIKTYDLLHKIAYTESNNVNEIRNEIFPANS